MKQSNVESKCPGLGFGVVTTASTQVTTCQEQVSCDAGTNPSSPFTLRARCRGKVPGQRERGWGGRQAGARSHLRPL